MKHDSTKAKKYTATNRHRGNTRTSHTSVGRTVSNSDYAIPTYTISELAEQVSNSHQCKVYKLKVITRTGQVILQVYKADQTPLDMDTCVLINREFSKLISVYHPRIKTSCDIEVSSAGIDRFIQLDELQYYTGKLIKVWYEQNNIERVDVLTFENELANELEIPTYTFTDVRNNKLVLTCDKILKLRLAPNERRH